MLARLVLGAWTIPTTVGMGRSFNASVAGRMEGLERCRLYVVGAQALHRTRRPERPARASQLSLGDEIWARKDVLEHRNLQGSRRK
jgi:hypothetical protein